MPRKVFFSFHYVPDNWRASQVRNMGLIEGSAVATDNDWETVKRGGEAAIQRWIDGQIDGRSCGVVLIGSGTAGRKWINYEIIKCWNEGKGLVGVHIHSLKDRLQQQSAKGANPFHGITLKNGTVAMSSVVKAYDPPYAASTDVYNYISSNLEAWIEEAIKTRVNYT
jgi:hypothetical protein